MNIENIKIVKQEMKRLQKRISELDKAMQKNKGVFCWWEYLHRYPKQTGAIRRSSLDLTRALAEMRKTN